MWSWHGGGWAWLVMAPMMVVFWGLVIWAGLTVVRQAGAGRDDPGRGRGPEEVLRHRFAAGEIDATEYRQRLDVLHSTTPGGPDGSARGSR